MISKVFYEFDLNFKARIAFLPTCSFLLCKGLPSTNICEQKRKCSYGSHTSVR